MALTAVLARWDTATPPPLTPEGDEARRWAEEELSQPGYAEAQPTPFDLVAVAVRDFITDLLTADLPGGLGSTFVIVAAVVVGILLVAAILVWGVPRATRRSAASVGELFGESDERTAAQLRADAAARADAQEWDEAIVLRFRALARGLAERGLLHTPPGATVHAFARSAARVFPESEADLDRAAGAFDDVRYLRRPGSAARYRHVAELDDRLTTSRPALREEAPA